MSHDVVYVYLLTIKHEFRFNKFKTWWHYVGKCVRCRKLNGENWTSENRKVLR